MAGNKNSGRKTDAEILRHYIDADLANKIANRELKAIEAKPTADLDEMKAIVMPIVIKGMVDRTDITSDNKPIAILSNVSGSQSNSQYNGDEKENTGSVGGDSGQ